MTSPASPATPAPAASRRVELYDTTLRDGTQGLGISLTLPDKLAIASLLDELGFDYIEGGFPLSNPKDVEFFAATRRMTWRHAKLCAFGMTRRRGVKAEEDAGLRALVDSGAPVCTFVGKTHAAQVTEVLGVSLEENLEMIRESAAFLKAAGRTVFYDAEHFFDGWRHDPAYALETLKAAAAGGAERLVLCDTNGGSLPALVTEATRAAQAALPAGARLGIHVHNDGGLAVANTLAALEAGCVQAQGTLNGVGERCGNVDLTTVAANAAFKYGWRVLAPGALGRLTEVSRFAHARCGTHQPTGQPYTGPGAFAHKGGMHVHAVAKGGWTYEHVEPEAVGNSRRILVSELSGVSNIAAMLATRPGLAADKALQRRVLDRVQDLEHAGWVFEDAQASLELLVQELAGLRPQHFEVLRFRCEVAGGAGASATEATVKVRVAGRERLTVAEGEGPVHALDGALRSALAPAYGPALARLHLKDFSVRVVNPSAETAAVVRVHITFASLGADGEPKRSFTTLGVDANMIAAAKRALVDGQAWHLISEGVPVAR